MRTSNSKEVWTLKEAKAHLAQILHLAEAEGPQYISADHPDGQDPEECKAFVVVPRPMCGRRPAIPGRRLTASTWASGSSRKRHGGVDVKEPEYDESGRFVAFSDVVFDEEE